MLPLSHDEVVHGKGSLLGKMPGDEWQKFANLRLLFGYMYAQPGKKLLFMGGEFGQWREWNHDASLDWHLLDDRRRTPACSAGSSDLNRALPRASPRCTSSTASPAGFEWIDCNDAEQQRRSASCGARGEPDDVVVVVCNFTPVPRHNYRVGVPARRLLARVLNSDAGDYGGSGQGNLGGVEAAPSPARTAAPSRSTSRCRRSRAVFLRQGREARLEAHEAGADVGRTTVALGVAWRWRRNVWCPASGRRLRNASRSSSSGATDRVLLSPETGRLSPGRARRRPGARYALRLDGGPARPDPGLALPARGRARPVARSSIRRFAGPTTPGAACRSSDYVIYELHVGTFTPRARSTPSSRTSTTCATSASPRSS